VIYASAQATGIFRVFAGETVTKPTLDEFHEALGEFLTEHGRVEFTMLLVMDYFNEAGIEHLFDVYAPKTFGPKIDCMKAWCPVSEFAEPNKAIFERVYKDLEELLPKRNYIVHGETWEGAFKGKPKQPYRVGVTKDNLEYLDEFDRAQHGQNVLDVEQVREATKLCRKILADLNNLRGK
jgi:hypothetical protein